MLKIKLDIKPISVNVAFQGRRFKTKACKDYENILFMLLPNKKLDFKYYEIRYKFYLKNFSRTDADNLVKITQDILVKKKIIVDDRRIIDYTISKRPAKTDSIEIEIKEGKI